MRLGSVLQETHRSVEHSKGFLRLALRGYEGGGLGGWDTVLWDSGAFVGTCGVDVGHAPRPARAELGHVLSRHRRERCLRAC